MELFDTHSHYNDEKFDIDREEIIKDTYEFGITKFVCAGYNLESSKKALKIANKYEYIYAICGISPNDMEDYNSESLNEIKKMSKENKVVAIGEIGLDYYWNKDNKEIQKEAFIKQIEIANNLNLPIVIHTREAVQDTIDILKEHKALNTGILHCCPLNKFLVEEAIKLGFYISFAGPVTFKNSKNAEEIVRLVPNERLLIETDSPYLAPEPIRGTRNNSKNVIHIAKKISEIKNLNLDDIAEITYNNAKEVFKIK